MSIELDMTQVVKVKAKTVRVFAKLCDEGTYTLRDEDGHTIGDRENDYVPNEVIPGSSGDYIDLVIDLETGTITNWKKPTARALQEAFCLTAD